MAWSEEPAADDGGGAAFFDLAENRRLGIASAVDWPPSAVDCKDDGDEDEVTAARATIIGNMSERNAAEDDDVNDDDDEGLVWTSVNRGM